MEKRTLKVIQDPTDADRVTFISVFGHVNTLKADVEKHFNLIYVNSEKDLF